MTNRGKLQIRVTKMNPINMTAILSSFLRLYKKRKIKNKHLMVLPMVSNTYFMCKKLFCIAICTNYIQICNVAKINLILSPPHVTHILK